MTARATGFFLAVLAASGCASQYRTPASPKLPTELVVAVPAVREVVLAKLEMSEAERETIQTRMPRYGWYRMAGTYGQAFWVWSLPDGAGVIATMTGDLPSADLTETLDVYRRPEAGPNAAK